MARHAIPVQKAMADAIANFSVYRIKPGAQPIDGRPFRAGEFDNRPGRFMAVLLEDKENRNVHVDLDGTHQGAAYELAIKERKGFTVRWFLRRDIEPVDLI